MAVDILSDEKIQAFVKQYEVTKLHYIGNKSFYEKYANLLKLHQVATVEASTGECERVKYAFLKYNKTNYLIKDLISVSVWKEKVLPELLKIKPVPRNSLPTYIVLYQETVLVGLLQSLLYHPVIFSDIPDSSLIDLIDYCAYKFITIQSNVKPSDASIKLEANAIEDIEKHHRNLSFIVSTQCISIVRFICENLDNLPLNIASRIFSTHDIPVLIIHLFDNETWSKRIDGKLYKFCDFSWQQWFSGNAPLCKTEIQVLLLIHQLLVKSISTNVYTFNDYRKEQLSRLLKHLTDEVVEQLNLLSDLKRWILLNSLGGEQGPRITHPLILEVDSQYREALNNKYKGQWTDIALDCSKLMFYAAPIEMLQISKEFSGFLDNVEQISDMTKTCLTCFSKADKKCSKCKKAWYCSRKCQIEHWSAHKHLCKT